jgi:competence protein ComEA
MDGKKQNLLWALVLIVLGGVGGMVALGATQLGRPAPIVIEPPPATAAPEATATAQPLRVYISGAVQRPDVYTLPADSIVRDLVRMAGEFTADAAVEAVNLALPLADGMHVHIPVRDEVNTAPPVISVPAGPSNPVGATGTLININTATLEELDTLPGIGPSTAQKIIDHRTTHGPFLTIEAVLDVPGIGPVKFEQIKALITIG